MLDKCLLVDVSLYNSRIDWKILADNGVVGAIIRASAGSYRQDPLFIRHVEGAVEAGLVVGAYHWLDPNSEDEAQAKNFMQTIAGYPVNFLALDMEQNWKYWSEWYVHDVRHIIPGWRISENAYRVASYVKKNVNSPLVIYTRASFVSAWAPQASAWLSKFNLWLAYYPYARIKVNTTWDDLKTNYMPKVFGPLLPPGVENWVLWQFSGDKFTLEGTGGSAIDLNLFNGTKQQFEQFISTGTPPVRTIDPVLPKKARTLYRLNVRSSTVVSWENIVGKLNPGTIVDVYELRRVGLDLWARIGPNQWVAMMYRNVRLMVWV